MFIAIKNITVQAGKRMMFENTTWMIDDNQNWGIIGKTGAGKSILAKVICKQVSLAAGRVEYFFDDATAPAGRSDLHNGEILTVSSESHQNFLRSYAEYHQARWQSFEGDDAPTVAKVLFDIPEMGLRTEHASDVKDDLVALFNLERLLDRKIIHLSHGESRKVLIARMYIRHSPRLLILDDPFNGLDRESRGVLAHGIQGLMDAGKTSLLFISSRPEDLPQGIDHVMLVQDGQVVDCGEREEILRGDAFHQVYAKPNQVVETQRTQAFDRMIERYSKALNENPAFRATNSSAEVVRMENVCVRYDTVEVLQEINWTIHQGERWALLGQNGAGKSTLLSLIMGDNPQAYANQIYLFGRLRGSGQSIWEIKQNIGWVSPELNAYYRKSISCNDVVCSGLFDSIGLYLQCSDEQKDRAAGWMAAFGLQDLANENFQSLSAGQRRLVLLARAMVKNPALLILDEPCQALDDTHRDEFVGFLDHLCRSTAMTLIYVTHYQAEIPGAMTHQLRLEHGRMRSCEALV